MSDILEGGNAEKCKKCLFAVLRFAFYLVRLEPGIGILKQRAVNPQIYVYVKFSREGIFINSFRLFSDIRDCKMVRITTLEVE